MSGTNVVTFTVLIKAFETTQMSENSPETACGFPVSF